MTPGTVGVSVAGYLRKKLLLGNGRVLASVGDRSFFYPRMDGRKPDPQRSRLGRVKAIPADFVLDT